MTLADSAPAAALLDPDVSTGLLKISPAAALGNKTRIVASLGPEIARAFNAAAADVPSLAAARRSLEAGGADLVSWWERIAEAFLRRIRPTLRQALFGAAAAEASRIRKETGCDSDFDVLDDGIRLAVSNAEGVLRERLFASGRASVAGLVGAVATGGLALADAARLVVEGRALSLTDSSQGLGAVLNYRRTLTNGKRKAERIRAMMLAYSRRLSRQRAALVAANELGGMYEEGLLQAAIQAERAGCVGDGWGYQWVARPTAESICQGLHGLIVRAGELFDGRYRRPPAHVRCQCTLRLVRIRGR